MSFPASTDPERSLGGWGFLPVPLPKDLSDPRWRKIAEALVVIAEENGEDAFPASAITKAGEAFYAASERRPNRGIIAGLLEIARARQPKGIVFGSLRSECTLIGRDLMMGRDPLSDLVRRARPEHQSWNSVPLAVLSKATNRAHLVSMLGCSRRTLRERLGVAAREGWLPAASV